MLITDRFVFVHLPKTGGMFVDGVLKKQLCASKLMRRVHSLRSRYGVSFPGFPYRYWSLRRHSSCASIPEWARDRLVFAVIRQPLDWYVSDYRFGLWKKDGAFRAFWDGSAETRNEIANRYPRWPELSFEEYVFAANHFTKRVADVRRQYAPVEPHGLLTLEFLRLFCRDRKAVLSGDAGGFVERAREFMYPVRFLHQDRLNKDLADLLCELGYPQDMAANIRTHSRVYPGRRTRDVSDDWRSYYSDALMDYVRQRDRLLYELFPQFDDEFVLARHGDGGEQDQAAFGLRAV